MRKQVLIAALLVACDDDDPVRHLDGGVTIDSTIDAAVQPVTLTIKRNGAPQQGVVVHYQNADSSLVATETTDATGKVSHTINAGGYVTAVDPYAVQAGLATSTLRTFAGVKPGDELQLAFDNPTSVTMTLTLPVQGNPAISRYIVDGTCMGRRSFASSGSGFQPTGTVSFTAGCTSTDLIAVSFDANNAVVGYFVVIGQAITANGTLDYSAKSYSAPTARNYTLNNVPAQLNTPILYQHILNANGELIVLDQDGSGGTTSIATMGLPTIANGISVVEVNASTSQSDHFLYDWGPLATTPFTTDFGARKLVDVSAPSYNKTTHTASWTEGSGATPDVVYMRLFGTRSTTTTSFGVDWELVGPHAAGTRAFPTLPVTNIDYNFDSDDTVEVNDLVLAKTPSGYDAIRANALIVLDAVVHDGIVTGLTATSTGSLSVVRYLPVLTLTDPTPKTLRHRFAH